MDVIYLRTGAKGVVHKITPIKSWPDHCLRVEFQGGAGFTFHQGELWNLFRREKPQKDV